MTVFTAGECPLCGIFGPLYFAKAPSSGSIFFACILCGVAWKSPPRPLTVDSTDPIGDYAPKGFLLPSREDIVRAGLERNIQSESDLGPDEIKSAFEQWLHSA